jgi:hypothetical protein
MDSADLGSRWPALAEENRMYEEENYHSSSGQDMPIRGFLEELAWATMTEILSEIYSATDAAREEGAILLSDPSPQERLLAARILGRHDAGGYLVQNALLVGLQDHSPEVRIEVYKSLARMHYSRIEDLSCL